MRQPIGPAPAITTLRPRISPARSIACRQTASGSAQAATRQGMVSGMTWHWSARATTCSEKAPWTCGKIAALPKNRMWRHRLLRPQRQ